MIVLRNGLRIVYLFYFSLIGIFIGVCVRVEKSYRYRGRTRVCQSSSAPSVREICRRESDSRSINYRRDDVYVSVCTGWVSSRPRASPCARCSPDHSLSSRRRRRLRFWTTTDDGKLDKHAAAADEDFVTTRGKFDFWVTGKPQPGVGDPKAGATPASRTILPRLQNRKFGRPSTCKNRSHGEQISVSRPTVDSVLFLPAWARKSLFC